MTFAMAGDKEAVDNGSNKNGCEKMSGTDGFFSLDDYDCIGFDMDCTVVQYHIAEMFKVRIRDQSSLLTKKA